MKCKRCTVCCLPSSLKKKKKISCFSFPWFIYFKLHLILPLSLTLSLTILVHKGSLKFSLIRDSLILFKPQTECSEQGQYDTVTTRDKLRKGSTLGSRPQESFVFLILSPMLGLYHLCLLKCIMGGGREATTNTKRIYSNTNSYHILKS